MLLQLYTTVGAKLFGPGDSIRCGCVSQNHDNTLGRLGTGLASAGEDWKKLAIVHFGA